MKELNVLILSFMQFLLFYLLILLSVAFFSLLERKILGIIHFRKGPNKVLMKGLIQPFSDAMKLISKDDFSPSWSNKVSFYMGPLMMMFLASLCWTFVPSYWVMFCNPYSLLIIYFVLGLTVYGLVLSGWSSNSKFAMIGAMRAISQTVSYEVVFSFIVLCVVFFFSSFSLSKVHSFSLPICGLLPISVLTLFCMMVELNRTPFDLAEGESELVSGYSIEYGGVMYTFVFLSENMFSVFSCFFMALVYFGFYSLLWYSMSVVLLLLLMCLMRSIFPRIRYDKLMSLGWKKILPMIMLLSNLYFIILCL